VAGFSLSALFRLSFFYLWQRCPWFCLIRRLFFSLSFFKLESLALSRLISKIYLKNNPEQIIKPCMVVGCKDKFC
jgi:hypothetical protein